MNEFKPGDVVVHPKHGRGIVTGDYRPEYVEFSDVECEDIDYVAADLRRLVVIDPEDREQVERLSELLYVEGFGETERHRPYRAGWVDAAHAALREFANPKPPKPEEPTGLGAVVEDAAGTRWLLASPESIAAWMPESAAARGREAFWRTYHSIDAVRVLSEGVQP